MTIPFLTIVPAGAGSGKTYRIQTQLAEWVVDGRAAPDRIAAVTFTEAAASELKKRIRFELVRRGRIEDALKLERSCISTIHGFCVKTLTEFAFEGGISPAPRLLNDDEQQFLIRRALSRTGKAEPVAVDLKKFGFRRNFVKDESPEDVFRKNLLSLIGRLRSLGVKGEDAGLAGSAAALLRKLYGGTGDAESMNRALHGAVETMRKRFPHDLSPDFAGNKSAFDGFKNDYGNLCRAEDLRRLSSDWALWAALRKLRTSARGCKLPPGYKETAEAVIAAAGGLPRHPGPLADAETYVISMLQASRECLRNYGDEKRKACLVDYPDMIALADAILSTRPDVLAILKGRIDCLVIDEFQDTNPLQFSLLWRIHEAGVPALIVGDLKQSIMGFTTADPRLFAELEKAHPEACEPLTSNWRATAPLMEWVNAVGEGLFGRKYTRLEPKADFESAMAPLEVIEAPRFIRKSADRASWTAVRIRRLLDDEKAVVRDKGTKGPRRLRGGDIAVLCPTHSWIDTYAEVLRSLGIRTRVAQTGWSGSPEVQLLLHALAYLADRNDRHAALYLSVTEAGNHTLEEALETLRRGGDPEDPVLDLLEPLRAGAAAGTVESVVADVIETLDLYGRVSAWPESAQARANLLKAQAMAREFGEANRQVLLAGGYYGQGIKTFLAWLAARGEELDGQPEPRVLDEDAVTVTTWHGSKGLEWPVVAVCGMTDKVEPRYPDISVQYEDFGELGDILGKARVEIVPPFDADETKAAFQAHLQPALEDEARRLLYVALTRAREKLILEWPGHLAGKEKAHYWNLLSETAGMKLGKDSMVVNGREFPCVIRTADAGADPEAEGAGGSAIAPPALFGRRAIERRGTPAGGTPEFVKPSLLRGDPFPARPDGLVEDSYGPPLEVGLGVAGAERGLVLHRFFELAGVPEADAEAIRRAPGREIEEDSRRRLEEAASAFGGWMEKRLRPIRVLREVPLLGMDDRGSVVSGVVDLLVESAEGYWILDHKSDIVEDRDGRFGVYLPQLRAYADLVRKALPGKPVLGVGIHWISCGTVGLHRSSQECTMI